MAAVYVYVIILTFLGPEFRGRHMGVANDADLQAAAGTEAVERIAHGGHRNESGSEDDKAV